jgi:hypothetical protein
VLDKSHTTCQYSAAALTATSGVKEFTNTFWQFIKPAGYLSFKHTVKPALITEIRRKRQELLLNFDQRCYLDRQNKRVLGFRTFFGLVTL